MRVLFLSCAVLLALTCTSVIRAEDAEHVRSVKFDAERFYRDVRHLVRRHYRDATAHRLDDKIHFEHDTRIFVVHTLSKTGEWQDPREQRGPKRGGVHCDIVYRPGPYRGAAARPQVIDRRYFELHLYAPYSEKLDGHLYVHLRLPGLGTPPEGFHERLTELINGFEAYTVAE